MTTRRAGGLHGAPVRRAATSLAGAEDDHDDEDDGDGLDQGVGRRRIGGRHAAGGRNAGRASRRRPPGPLHRRSHIPARWIDRQRTVDVASGSTLAVLLATVYTPPDRNTSLPDATSCRISR